jgi:two-component system, NtrC family, response regulator HydG
MRRPYIQLNCAALNEALLESELFGHVKGAFTGAYRHRQGRFEAAHGGGIFLDEIGDIPLSIQVKLLRVLETKQFERVGDHRPISVGVRIIAATHRNIAELVAAGKFREDLWFRINMIPIHLAALRDRMEVCLCSRQASSVNCE